MLDMNLQERIYTISEWEKLPEYPRYELIDGKIVLMAPATWDHQSISTSLISQFGNYLRGKKCFVAHSVGVQFHENEDLPSVFIPDIVIVCDPKKIHPQGLVGAPDLIVEILSPSTGGLDKIKKFDRYMREGVREYWIVDPVHRVVDVYQWENASSHTYSSEDKIKVGVLDDCEIDLSLVFPALADEDIDNEPAEAEQS